MQVLCAAWTADGQHLALGMYNGHISICDKSGVEQALKFSLLSPAMSYHAYLGSMINHAL